MAKRPDKDRMRELKRQAKGAQEGADGEPDPVPPQDEGGGGDATPSEAKPLTKTPAVETDEAPQAAPETETDSAILLLTEQMARQNELTAKLIEAMAVDKKPILDLLSLISDCLKAQGEQQAEATKQMASLERAVTKLGEKPETCSAKAVGDLTKADVIALISLARDYVAESKAMRDGESEKILTLRGELRAARAAAEQAEKKVYHLEQQLEAMDERLRACEVKLGVGAPPIVEIDAPNEPEAPTEVVVIDDETNEPNNDEDKTPEIVIDEPRAPTEPVKIGDDDDDKIEID